MDKKGSYKMTIDRVGEAILNLILEKSPRSAQGVEFVQRSIESLTLCLSQIIKSGYCQEHYKTGYDIATKLIQEDLGLKEEPPK